MSLWALPQLLQALCAALLSKLLMRLPSNPFRQSELDLFKLQVLFWPKQVSEQSQKWFKYCAYWICYLCVWLCLEKDVCTHGTVTSPLLGELGGWIWTYLLQPGESITCCTFESWSITSRFISALFSKTNNNQTWIMLNAVCVLQFSWISKWNSELDANQFETSLRWLVVLFLLSDSRTMWDDVVSSWRRETSFVFPMANSGDKSSLGIKGEWN